jgi:hypothetical protein
VSDHVCTDCLAKRTFKTSRRLDLAEDAERWRVAVVNRATRSESRLINPSLSRVNHIRIVRRGRHERFARVNQRRLSSTAPNAVTRMMAATTGAHLVQQITLSKADGIKREHEQDEFAGVTYPLRPD